MFLVEALTIVFHYWTVASVLPSLFCDALWKCTELAACWRWLFYSIVIMINVSLNIIIIVFMLVMDVVSDELLTCNDKHDTLRYHSEEQWLKLAV